MVTGKARQANECRHSEPIAAGDCMGLVLAGLGLDRDSSTPRRKVTVLEDQRYSVDELRDELRRFERELRAAGLKETSVTTYIDRTGRFLKWLDGDYQPRGPN
jgi:hypothetical protein